MANTLKILRIDASGRRDESSSRALTDDLVKALEHRHESLTVTRRDLADSLPHVDEAWIDANFTPPEDRSTSQRESLALSDTLVNELMAADVLVIGMPIYNFGVPAALKAWVDMIARARLTFRYTADGPKGLLEGRKAYLVVASGGVAVDSPVDFATPYMRHALSFIGITDVEVIAAERQNVQGDEALSAARARIADLIHAAPAAEPRAATA